jgi:type I restriction-modification system DNA methylase subunit
MADIKITDEIRAVLDQCEFTETTVKLPDGQLDRALYVKINKLFEECSGVWSKKLKLHVFPSNPKEKLGMIVETGVLVDKIKARQAYYTPLWLVEKVVKMADVKYKTVMEPSFGDGRFIKECMKQGACWIDGIESDEEAYEKALVDIPDGETPVHLRNSDFLKWETSVDLDGNFKGYDILIGNPPYKATTWLKHTLHAYKFVKEGGKLVFILPNSIHSNKKFQDFVADKVWEFETVPKKSFEDTDIETNIVTIYK